MAKKVKGDVVLDKKFVEEADKWRAERDKGEAAPASLDEKWRSDVESLNKGVIIK